MAIFCKSLISLDKVQKRSMAQSMAQAKEVWHKQKKYGTKIFLQNLPNVRISEYMNKYVYQISGALESAQGQFKGLQVLVCDLYNFDSVNVPAEILDRETVKFLEFRLKLSDHPLSIQKLPNRVQNNIRIPLGKWLDQWVLENFYGDTSNRKSVNP